MSTKGQRLVEIRDFRQFAIDFVESRGKLGMDGNNQDTSEGVNLGPADGAVSGSPFWYGLYCHISDTYLWLNNQDKTLSTTGRAYYSAVYAHDAVLQNPDVGWWVPQTYNPRAGSSSENFNYFGNTSAHRFVAGQPNLQTMEQSFYWYQGEWSRYSMIDASSVEIDIWPNIGQSLLVNGAATGATAGYWSAATGGVSSARYCAIVFEGITDTSDGMAGETDADAGMLRGGTSHPSGLMLAFSDEYNFDGSGTGSDDHDPAWLWVDIDTGLAVGKLGIVANRDSDTETRWQGPSVDLRNGFDLHNIQFVPDPDSSFARPKGELHVFFVSESSYTVTNRTQTDPDGNDFTPAESVQQMFVIYDFNPFNETGSVERIHNRRRQEGTLVVFYDPLMPGGSWSLVENSGSRYNHISPNVYYHPPSRTYVNVQASYMDASNNGTGQPEAETHRIIRFARDHKADAVSFPAPDAAVIENGASYFDVYVTNELLEPVADHTVYFQTFRQSTRAETFDGTATGASPYVVDNGVIDEDGFLDVREGGNVDSGGTLLVEGVDYTVTYGTGTLTPIGSWPTDDIYVRYRHRSVEISPGWGTLQASSATTDVDGKATAIILFPDNLDGELVGLNVDTETPF